jgi:hypothetical protein
MAGVTMNTMQMPCGKCGMTVDVLVGQPRVANFPESSIVSLSHDATVDCPHCRAHLGIMLIGAPGYAFRTVEVQRENKILMPGNGLHH